MKWNHEKILDIFNKENEDLITFGRNIFDIINLNKINYRETYFDDYLKRLKNNKVKRGTINTNINTENENILNNIKRISSF